MSQGRRQRHNQHACPVVHAAEHIAAALAVMVALAPDGGYNVPRTFVLGQLIDTRAPDVDCNQSEASSAFGRLWMCF